MLIVLLECLTQQSLPDSLNHLQSQLHTQTTAIPIESWIPIVISSVALIASIVQFAQNNAIRKSRKMTEMIIDSWNRAIDNLLLDPTSRVLWISAARIFGRCANDRTLVTSEEDKKVLESEVQLLRERVYPLFDLDAINYAGQEQGEINELPATHFLGGSVVSETSLSTIWNTILYPSNVNEYYPDSSFTEPQLRQLPDEISRYIRKYRESIANP